MSKLKSISKEAVKASIFGTLIIAILQLFGVPVPAKIVQGVELVKTIPSLIKEATTAVEAAEQELEAVDAEE